ncbi:flagellar biosynthetic protein FliO [Massilia sp. TS11]|uniref:flagellar biosynthetic protein FliO n=1 Tax=Massilia sp. TS11 TaxID=2908003 RepID=UPI001EDA66DF|nr:flagellar biosynthetic protein FliO [Massilia sp. TS11]MCG2582872.1 flagellar biosynthetic protein FliO [Massilia sp. TS11]
MRRLLAPGLLAWSLAAGVAGAAPVDAPAASAAASVSAASVSAAPPAAAPAAPGASAPPYYVPPPVTGSAVPASSLFQSVFGLLLVLGVLLGLAWALKRFGPQALHAPKNIKLVGAVSLGGRERVAVLEVGETWIVVGSAPGRVNTLATLARPPQADTGEPSAPAPSFSDWLQQTLKKRDAS